MENNAELFKVFIEENDKLWLNGGDEWDPKPYLGPSGSHVFVLTGEYTKKYDGLTFFTYKEKYKQVPASKHICIYAINDGKSFYEVITGKEMKKWEATGGSYYLDKFIYYDHVEAVDIAKAVEDIKYVKDKDERVQAYIEGLNQYEVKGKETRIAKKNEEIKKNNDTEAAKQYINNYKRPNR